MRWLFLALLWLLPAVASADNGQPTVSLTRGINITGWFRFPGSQDPTVLVNYLSNQALADIRSAGFDFVRLAVDPDIINVPVLLKAIRRIQLQGLTVVVTPFPNGWQLETQGARLVAFWQQLAPALAAMDPARTVVEVVNEPVFSGNPAGWAALQHTVLLEIRSALPNATVMLTGQDWSSVGGLLALTPENDPNVVYTFHFYDPSELTSLAAYQPGLDQVSLALLPFPVGSDCATTADISADAATRDMAHYYCAMGWDVAAVTAPIEQAAAWGRTNNVRVVAGEFGATAALNPTARLTWLSTVRQAFETSGIAWALWGYDDIMGFNVPRPPAPRPVLDPGVLGALGLTTGL